MCGSHDIEQTVMSASRDRSAAKFRDKSSVTGDGRNADFCTLTAYWGRFKKTWPKVDLLGLRGREPMHAGGDCHRRRVDRHAVGGCASGAGGGAADPAFEQPKSAGLALANYETAVGSCPTAEQWKFVPSVSFDPGVGPLVALLP
jgi:hypothetical protein